MDSVYLHLGLFAATYSIGNKEQKLMQAIDPRKKFCLEFHKYIFISGVLLFNVFICDLFIIFKEIHFPSYADDNTPSVSEATPENVVSSLESCSTSLLE